jgi:L-ascorbate metabolism protein UlaG (beta-lactamase superfamily)
MRILKIVFLLLVTAPVAKTQTNEITIRYIGNCGLHMTDGTHHIYTDFPYKSGAHHYAEYPDSELDSIREGSYFLFTHNHTDHYYKWKAKKIAKRKNAKMYGKRNIEELDKISAIIPGLTITAFKTGHRFSFAHYSYLITWHNKKIYLSGDTETAETILSMKDLDCAFIPAWLFGKIIDSNQKSILLDAKSIGIYHIGPKDDVRINWPSVRMFTQRGETQTIPY